MSYLSIKQNNLKTFFCSNCDELLNKGAFYDKDSKFKILCQKCCGSELSLEEQKKRKVKESHQEISECLEVIEKTVRKTRNPQPLSKQQQEKENQLEWCEICEEENKQQKNQAEFYLNDKMMFCSECFHQQHKTTASKRHSSMTIEQWKKESQNKNSKRKENNQREKEEEEKEKYFCVEHKSVEPIFCVDDSQMFCLGCSLNGHTNHRMKSIESRSKEEKQRINLEQSFKEFEERKKEFVEIEEQLKSMIEVFEQQIQECGQMVNEIQETTVSLRESIEHWGQIEKEVDDKEWCKREFVERVKSQVERVGQKFKEREREMRKRTREMVERIDWKMNGILDQFKWRSPFNAIERSPEIHTEAISLLSKIINSSSEEIWKDSSILFDSKQINFLNDSLKESGFNLITTNDNNNKPIKLFQGTVDGFSSQSFHKKCDNQGKTVVLVRTTTSQIFGAFSNVEWDSSSGIKSNSEKKSFLFSLDYLEKYSLTNDNNNNQYEIYCHSSYGPTFGYCYGYGVNLHLSNNCNSNYESYNASHTNSKSAYSIGNNNNNSKLTEPKNDGSRYHFKVEEYEVWRIK